MKNVFAASFFEEPAKTFVRRFFLNQLSQSERVELQRFLLHDKAFRENFCLLIKAMRTNPPKLQ